MSETTIDLPKEHRMVDLSEQEQEQVTWALDRIPETFNHKGKIGRKLGADGGAVAFFKGAASRPHTTFIVSIHSEGAERWLHASIAHPGWMPSYDELKLLHHAVFMDRHAYQVFVPSDQHVNIHESALHLWGILGEANGSGRVLPDFGRFGTI